MSIIHGMLERSPRLEVFLRHVYWRSESLRRNLPKSLAQVRRRQQPQELPVSRLIEALASLGVNTGDILIVHSDFGPFKAAAQKPSYVLDALRELVGSSGTLAMPTIPLLRGQPYRPNILKDHTSKVILEYDPRRSPAWTGALPNALLRLRGVVRSLHPLNTMAAIGADAEPMMAGNLDNERPLPCGCQSSWHFCYLRNAKIAAVGVDAVHSLTMIHVAEDMDDQIWSRRNWYRERKFRIVGAGGSPTKDDVYVVRERDPKWAMFFAERRLYRDLVDGSLLRHPHGRLGSDITVIESQPLIEYLKSKNSDGYPYYMVPRSGVRPSRRSSN